jgi:hypothetical protein
VNPTPGALYKKPSSLKSWKRSFRTTKSSSTALAADPNPSTFACLPSLAAAAFASGLKRSRVIPTEGAGEIEDTGAASSGGHKEANASGAVNPVLLPTPGPAGQEDDDMPPEMARANAVTAFMAFPLLLEPNQLRADHIIALMALAVDGHVHKAAIKLLAPAYSQQEAEAIWTAWAPHHAPSPGHPLAGGTLLLETIMQSLYTPYPTAKLARDAADRLLNDIAKAVVTHTFVAHTAADLPDEEMEVLPHPSRFGHIQSYFQPLGHSLHGSCCRTSMIPPRRTPSRSLAKRTGDTRQPEARHLTGPLLPD